MTTNYHEYMGLDMRRLVKELDRLLNAPHRFEDFYARARFIAFEMKVLLINRMA